MINKRFWLSSYPSKVCSVLAIVVFLFVVYLVVGEQIACAQSSSYGRGMCGLMSNIAIGIGVPTILALLFFGWFFGKLWKKSILGRKIVRFILSLFSGFLITFIYVVVSQTTSLDSFLNKIEARYSSLFVWVFLFLVLSLLSYLILPKGKYDSITQDSDGVTP